MRRRGFTIIELLFVISIIAVLAAILFPVFARARELARRGKCSSNLQQVGMALSLYARDHDGHFPKKNNDFWPVYPYAHNRDVFCCPSDSVDPGIVNDKNFHMKLYSSYVYRGGLTNDDRADTLIAGESQIWHGVANVLHLGGYFQVVPADGYKPVVKPAPKPNERPLPPSGAMPPGPPPSAPGSKGAPAAAPPPPPPSP